MTGKGSASVVCFLHSLGDSLPPHPSSHPSPQLPSASAPAFDEIRLNSVQDQPLSPISDLNITTNFTSAFDTLVSTTLNTMTSPSFHPRLRILCESETVNIFASTAGTNDHNEETQTQSRGVSPAKKASDVSTRTKVEKEEGRAWAYTLGFCIGRSRAPSPKPQLLIIDYPV
ncbi:hypothetical protein BDZ97DRAFT_2074431 [Flammula alnicola]|nr:hypothetical protein BDZ97DRAFT_2074431 [Flammula alnicola]